MEQREIKFRAFDNEKKEMYRPAHEAYMGNLFELMIGFSGDLSAHTMEGLRHESLFKGRFILMQFTGLKDKNGKEIYEGDNLKCIHRLHKPSFEMIGTVVWKTEAACFDICYKSDWISIGDIDYSFEVIGNIYEPKP